MKHDYKQIGAYNLYHPNEKRSNILKLMISNPPKQIGVIDVYFCPHCGTFKTNIINFYKTEKQLIK